MHHKDKRRISAWLKDLREKHYLEWIYQTDHPVESKTPAVYYLALNGIRYLREHEDYPAEELRKRYTESKRKQSFIDRCLLLADCCIDMDARTTDETDIRTYSYVVESDYLDPDNAWNFLAKSEYIHPHLYYLKEVDTEDDLVLTHNLLEVIDPTLPRYSLRKKLKDYVQFLDSNEWEEGAREVDGNEDNGDNTLPIVMIACPTKATLIYAKRITRTGLAERYGEDKDDIPEDIQFRFTTVSQIKQYGITGKVWEKLG